MLPIDNPGGVVGMRRYVTLVLVIFIIIFTLIACGQTKEESSVVNYEDIPMTEFLLQAVTNENLDIVGYGFTWRYAGMPSVFVEVTGTQNLASIGEKYGINVDVDKNVLYDLYDGDGKMYIDSLPCKGNICTLKALRDKLADRVPPVKFNVYIKKGKGFRLDFFLPKAGMTWENTASLTSSELLDFIADILDVGCETVENAMGVLTCRQGDIVISVGKETGVVIYGVK